MNELKLEERDLHDDPTFAVEAVASYVRRKTYSIKEMEAREIAIRDKAEARVISKLAPLQRVWYFWVLKHARMAVRDRENLRFLRTKVFGLMRRVYNAIGERLYQMGALPSSRDVFYLTTEEIEGFVEGRPISIDLAKVAQLRQSEFEKFDKSPAPPDRFVTYGPAGLAMSYPQVLFDADLLIGEQPKSSDPNILLGTPCCPGVVEGAVRVAKTLQDAQGLKGEILVTERTDPGWVPLYPSCSGLLIERGSLLSHSAVVARELGLPTIVGISGGMMKMLATGHKVRMDASKGEVRIIP